MTENGSKEVVTHTPAGKWAAGNPGGPGRPPAKKEERFYELVKKAVPDQDVIEIFKVANEQAKKGNWRAREFIMNYRIGRPIQRVAANVNSRIIQVIFDDDWGNKSS